MKKKKFLYSTGNMVIAYNIAYMLLSILYCLPRLIAEVSQNLEHVFADFTFPLSIFSWGLVAINSAYAGIDRIAMMSKTSMMEVGKADMGDPQKLRKIIYLLTIIFVQSVALHFFFGFDKIVNGITYHGVIFPLDGITTSLVSCITIYVAGNKGIRVFQSLDNTKEEQPWANEKPSISIETVDAGNPKENKEDVV